MVVYSISISPPPSKRISPQIYIALIFILNARDKVPNVEGGGYCSSHLKNLFYRHFLPPFA